MKEILHSKVMIGFIIFVLGFTYLNSIQIQNFEQTDTQTDLVYMNP